MTREEKMELKALVKEAVREVYEEIRRERGCYYCEEPDEE